MRPKFAPMEEKMSQKMALSCSTPPQGRSTPDYSKQPPLLTPPTHPLLQEYYAKGGPGTDITDAIPSLDMRPVLALFSPEDAFLHVETCGSCGGHLEIVARETKRVARLTKRIT